MISGKTRLIAHIGYPDRVVQGAADLQPLVRQHGHRRGRRADGREGARTTRRPWRRSAAHQHPRRAGDDAAQGDDGRRCSTRSARRCRSPARATRCCCGPTARCSATCSTARASCAACSARASRLRGASCLVVGTGGVGSAIAASLAAEGPARDHAVRHRARLGRGARGAAAAALSGDRRAQSARNDPAGYDLVVNGTPLGHEAGRSAAVRRHRGCRRRRFVGEVVMKQEITPLLQAARDRGCRYPGRHRHAVRDDPGLPRVLRLRHRDARRAARGRAGLLLTPARAMLRRTIDGRLPRFGESVKFSLRLRQFRGVDGAAGLVGSHHRHAQAQGAGGQPRADPRGRHRRVRLARLQGREHGRDRRAHADHARADQLLLRQQGEALPRGARARLRRDPRGRERARARPPPAGRGDPPHRRVHLQLLRRARVLRAPRRRREPGQGPAHEALPGAAHGQPPDRRHARRRDRARTGRGRVPPRRRSDRRPHGDRRPGDVQRHQSVHLRHPLPAGHGREGRCARSPPDGGRHDPELARSRVAR